MNWGFMSGKGPIVFMITAPNEEAECLWSFFSRKNAVLQFAGHLFLATENWVVIVFP